MCDSHAYAGDSENQRQAAQINSFTMKCKSTPASSAEIDERYVQKQLGHASAELTRRYQRRSDRFGGNLTTAAGL